MKNIINFFRMILQLAPLDQDDRINSKRNFNFSHTERTWQSLGSRSIIISFFLAASTFMVLHNNAPEEILLPSSWQSLVNKFPANFGWGCATSAFQLEGQATEIGLGRIVQNSWTRHKNLPQPGAATGHYDRYKEDIQLLKKAGINWYRFSLPWYTIMPTPGEFDQEVMNHYVSLVDECLANGITPMACLFHHTWPVWFDDIGGFEKAENIKHFTAFASYVAQQLKGKVCHWMTFNEPVGYCLEGWYRKKYPPFKKSMKLCGQVVLNMLNAHVDAYQAIKKIDPQNRIGLCQIYQPLHCYHNYDPLEKLATYTMNYAMHESVLEFFKSGHFSWMGMVKGKNSLAPQSLDWMGINYYTRTIIKHKFIFSLKPSAMPGAEIMGSDRECYPNGLAWAIKITAEYLPNTELIITENGVNDPHNIWKDKYMREHLTVVADAIAQGHNITGYHWWTFIDSFSWKRGTDSKMGLYTYDEKTFERSLHPGVQNFINFLHVQEHRRIAS